MGSGSYFRGQKQVLFIYLGPEVGSVYILQAQSRFSLHTSGTRIGNGFYTWGTNHKHTYTYKQVYIDICIYIYIYVCMRVCVIHGAHVPLQPCLEAPQGPAASETPLHLHPETRSLNRVNGIYHTGIKSHTLRVQVLKHKVSTQNQN